MADNNPSLGDLNDNLFPESDDVLCWSYDYADTRPFDCPHPTQFRYKFETGVRNGDCLPACFAGVLEAIHFGSIPRTCKEQGAKNMRAILVKWIKEHWEENPVFQPEMKVHEIMWMAHDVGIPQEERDKRGEWPDDPAGRLAAYEEQCETLYFSDAEMLMFSCMMFDLRGILFLFRTFRCSGMDDNAIGEHVSDSPDPLVLRANGFEEAVVIDLDHNGAVDGFSAHYKLLEFAGSLDGLLELTDPRPRRKRRLVKTGDLKEQSAKARPASGGGAGPSSSSPSLRNA